MARLGIRTTRLCAEIQALFDTPAQDQAWAQGLLSAILLGFQLDADFQSWIDEHACSPERGYAVQPPPPGLVVPSAQMLYLFRDCWLANTWMGCFSKRAHLHEVLLHCFALLNLDANNKAHADSLSMSYVQENDVCLQSQRIIADMIYGICASIPCILGMVDFWGQMSKPETRKPLGGYLSIWPLHVARASCEEGSERDIWLKSMQVSLSQDYGLRFAMHMARRTKTQPWDLK